MGIPQFCFGTTLRLLGTSGARLRRLSRVRILEQHAALQYQQGLAAMPPSQLVSHLQGRLKGKIAEADRLKKWVAEATLSLHTVSREGWELQGQLEQAEAKVRALATNASLTLPAASAEAPDLDALIGAMIQMQGLLPPELTSGFGACVRHIQKITSILQGMGTRSLRWRRMACSFPPMLQ